MRLFRRETERFVFHLTSRERDLFLQLLRLYPVTHGSMNRLSRGVADEVLQDATELLEEALAEHRAELRRELERVFDQEGCLLATDDGYSLSLATGQMEWVLQVLNDIRVGSWARMGSPDPPQDQQLSPSNTHLRHFWAMEVAGMFQSALLAALDAPVE